MKQLLMFVMLSLLLCWMMFAPIYKHVYILRQAVLQQEVDYLLEVGTSGQYGFIGSGFIEQSRVRLTQFGFEPNLLQYEIKSSEGASPVHSSQRILRGGGIQLLIKYPMDNLFAIDALIGISPPNKSYISAYGVQMSEYVVH